MLNRFTILVNSAKQKNFSGTNQRKKYIQISAKMSKLKILTLNKTVNIKLTNKA